MVRRSFEDQEVEALLHDDARRTAAATPAPARAGKSPQPRTQVVGDCRFRVSDESIDLAWVGNGDPIWMDVDASVRRMRDKYANGFLERRATRQESIDP